MKKMDLIKKILPKTYYADRGSEERIKLFVEHWRRLVKVNQELEEKVSRVELPVKPEIADMGRITMWVDMIWNDIFDDDELPLTDAQMNIIGKYINDAKEKIRKQFSA